MMKLLKHYLKKRSNSIIIISSILAIISFVSQINIKYIVYRYPNQVVEPGIYKPLEKVPFAANLPFGIVIFFAIVLTIICVIAEFRFKMKKVTIDQMYSLPIKRSHLYITKYLLGLIEIIIPITVSYITLILIIITNNHMFDLRWLLPYYIGLIVFIIATYTCLAFAFTRCNTVVDGIINMAFYSFVITFLYGSLDVLIDRHYEFLKWQRNNEIYFPEYGDFILFAPMIYFNTIFNDMFIESTYSEPILPFVIVSCYLLIAAIVFGILLFVSPKKQKSEEAELKSNSLFAYSTMIPIYTALLIMLCIRSSVAGVIVTIIVSYVGYVVKNRSFAIGKKDLLIWGITSLASIIVFAIIASSIPEYTWIINFD